VSRRQATQPGRWATPFRSKGYNFCMTVIVSLRDMVDELQMLTPENSAYLNKISGEIITVSNEDFAMLENIGDDDEEGENDEDLVQYSDQESSYIQKVKRIAIFDDEYVKLPSSFDIHEYEMVERFCLTVPNEKISNALLGKIRGSGAFRRFKDTIYQYGIEKDWFKYRDEEYKAIAEAWLERHEFAYKDDMSRREKNS
jgi:hypothetical protein